MTADGWEVGIVHGDRVVYHDRPGRRTADPFDGVPGPSSARQVILEPVVSRSPHRHPHSEEIVFVASGRGRVWIDGEFHPVGPGSWYRIPAGTPHATLADAGERMSLICFFPHESLDDNIEELDVILEGTEEGSHG